MSGQRSATAKARRRKARRKENQRTIDRLIRDHGVTNNEPRFAPTDRTPCPDCMLENRLDVRTEPVFHPGGLQHSRIGQVPKPWNCETCSGRGYLDSPLLDPFDMVERESRESASRLRLWQVRHA